MILRTLLILVFLIIRTEALTNIVKSWHSQLSRETCIKMKGMKEDECPHLSESSGPFSDKCSRRKAITLLMTSSTMLQSYPAVAKQSTAEPSDEIVVKIPKRDLGKGLGLELTQLEYGKSIRVVVKSVVAGSTAEKLGIKRDWIVVNVNGESAERTDVEGVAILVSKAAKAVNEDDGVIEIRFRNPVIFREQLNNLSPDTEVTTQIAPGKSMEKADRTITTSSKGDEAPLTKVEAQSEDQRMTVSQLIPPLKCNRGATTDDLLEISYLGTVLETGQVFDGSELKIDGKTVPGRGGDVSLYFVLGKQPFGQFPPGWDLGLEGMCVGERRRLVIPPILAYGSVGLPRRNIPPNATLQYDITLESINGLATPQ